MRRTVTPLVLLTLLGCADGEQTASPCGSSVDVTLSTFVPAVATVRWDACLDSGEAWVEFGEAERPMTAPGRLVDGRWEAVLLGAKAGSEVTFQPLETAGGEIHEGEVGSVTTGDTPPGLPDIEVDGEATPGFIAAPLMTEPPAWVIVDTDGDYVWWYQDGGYIPGLFRMNLSRDGEAILFQPPSGQPNYMDMQDVVRMSFDGERVEAYPNSHRGTHEFVELPDGSLGLLRTETREVDGQDVHGDRLLELRQDGGEVPIWTIWDWAEFDPDTHPEEHGNDWSHANAMDFDEERGEYRVSLRNLGAIVTIDRAEGEVVEVFGGDHSDYVDADGSSAFTAWQHQFDVVEGGLLVHDNGSPDTASSRAAEYALDSHGGTAVLVWEYFPDPAYYNYALGDVSRLPSGHTLVTWSMAGQVDEVDAEGELVWRLNVELGAGIGYTTWLEQLQ